MMYNQKLISAIKVKNKIMREHGEDIFLPFGSEYSILLKNINSQKVKINISIDGEDILDGHSLIIEPNSEMDLERWLLGGTKEGPKLKFVEKTNEIRDSRDNSVMDGILIISYQYEKKFEYCKDTIQL